MGPSEGASRSRLYFTGVLAAGLLAVVLIVALSAGGEDGSSAPADPECVEAWNSDPAQVALGVHQFNGHGYSRVQVTRVAEDGGPLGEDEMGPCAVVFAADALDPEPGAAAQVLRRERWGPLSELPEATPDRLAALQSEAIDAANASLEGNGKLVPYGASG
jgi:hypothetical protein